MDNNRRRYLRCLECFNSFGKRWFANQPMVSENGRAFAAVLKIQKAEHEEQHLDKASAMLPFPIPFECEFPLEVRDGIIEVPIWDCLICDVNLTGDAADFMRYANDCQRAHPLHNDNPAVQAWGKLHSDFSLLDKSEQEFASCERCRRKISVDIQRAQKNFPVQKAQHQAIAFNFGVTRQWHENKHSS